MKVRPLFSPLVVILLLLPYNAMSQRFQPYPSRSNPGTGMRLLAACQHATENATSWTDISSQLIWVSDASYCDGLVHATFSILLELGMIDADANISRDQAELVVLKYLRDHPEKLNEGDVNLAWESLKTAFPPTAGSQKAPSKPGGQPKP
jgi:hypothetical protein